MKKFTFLKSVLLCIVLTFSIFNNTNAADYYWVNGTGNWSDFLGHWATTSGGLTNHTQAPGANDNVIFDANSFSLPLGVVTVDALATCNSMTWTGVTNNPAFAGSSELDVFGSLTFTPMMTTSYNGQLKFKSSNPGNTINFSTIPLSINQIEFSGTGEWSILSNIDIEAVWGQITIASGTVNFNNNIYKLGSLQSWDMGLPRIINLGSCTMDIQWFWLMNPSSVNFNSGTSTLNFKNGWFNGNGLTFYNVNFILQMPGEVQIQEGNVFHNLGLSDPNVTGLVLESGKIQTIYDIDFGATCAFRKTIRSNFDGQTATIKKVSGTVTENYLNIKDITVIGGASFTTNSGVNMGNVTNWTINASVPATYYWVGGTGNWSESNHWALSSGAAYPSGNNCVPTDVDNVIFDVNSFSALGESATINTNAFCKNMTWTGVTNNPSLNSSGMGSLFVYGSLTLDPLMTYNSFFYIYFMSDIIGNTITSAGKTINSSILFNGTGEWTLQDNLQFSVIYHNKGTFNLNNKNITGSIYSSNTTYFRTLNLGTSLIILNSSWDLNNNINFTLNAGTSVINLSGWQFNGGSKAYNTVNLINASSTYLSGSNTFQTLINAGSGDLQLSSGSTQTIVNNFTTAGNCSDLLQITSSISGTTATISKASGIITLNYVLVKDIAATGGATFNANNSINNGNVSGINFTALASQNYYWIGGTGNWSDPLHWSLSSGGSANIGGCIPTQVDNVFFDAASALAGQFVTINQAASCNNMNWTGVSVNATFNGTNPLDVYGNFILSNMVYSFIGDLNFKAADLGNTINTSGRILNNNNIYFSGAGEWLLQSAFSSSTSKYIYLNSGILRTNNNSITSGLFFSNNTSNRLLDLGSSTINVTYWYISNGLNMIILPGTSTLTVNNSSYFYGGGLNYNNVNIQNVFATYIFGSNTFNTLNIPSCTSLLIENGTTQTFNNIIFPNGTGCTSYFNLSSYISGSPAHFSMPAGILNKNWLSITDITTGGGATFNATNSQGIGTVTGWTITSSPGVNYYWIGNTGNWDEPAHWSLTSGGLPNPSSCIPGPQDSVFFDANSFTLTNQTATINIIANCKNMNWTGVTNSPNLGGSMQININGSLFLNSNVNISNYWGVFNFSSSLAGNTIFTAGKTINGLLFSGSGTYTLSDNLTTNWNGIQFNNGTLNTNNFSISGNNGNFTTNSSSIRTLNLGSSIINIATWDAINTTGLTFNVGTSEIIINGNGWQFNGGNLTYNNVTIHPNSWSFYINGSNTYNKLTIMPGASILFEAGKTQNTTDFIALGTIGNEISLKSATDGVTSGINQVIKEFCGDKLIIKDMVASGNTFYAGSNSINQGNNTGWTWSGVTAIDQYPAPVCETIPGGGSVSGINLTLLQSAIDGGSGSLFSWFEDPALTIPVATPTNATINDGIIFYAQVNDGTCSNVATVTYTVLPKPILTFATTNVSCFGSNDGNINMTVSNGTPLYTYQWTGGLFTEDITTLIANTYNVTVTDANICSTTSSVVVNQPAILAGTIAVTNVTCFGGNNGSITINGATGGGGTYDYSINGGTFWQASNTFTNLIAGTYNVQIRDAASIACVITLNATQSLNEPSILSGTVSKTDATCFSASNGSITIGSSAGGSGTFEYSINGGLAWQASNSFTNIASGIYNVQIRDMAIPTCIIVLNAALVINQPLALTATVTPTNVTICNGNNNGSIVMSAPGGGSSNYEYTINGGTNWQASPSFTNLTAATYDVQIRDANAITCTITLNSALVLSQPAILSATLNSTNVTCFNAADGIISITLPTGGGGTYQYTINGGTSWQASGTFNGLIAGNYDVRIRDFANPTCVITLNAALAISQPAILAATITSVDVSVCNGNNNGNITINGATGGGGTYEYSINGGGAWQASNIFNNLIAGTYDIRIRDQAVPTCTITLNALLTLNQPGILSGTVVETDATCFGAVDGYINVINAVGGSSTFQYSCNGGIFWQDSWSFTNLAAGTYDIRIRDAANPTCIVTLNSTVVVNQPATLTATVTPVNASGCFGNNNGSIVMSSPTGGSGNFEYSITGGANWLISPSFTNLTAGTYNVQIRDANETSCYVTLNSTLTLSEPGLLVATVNKTDATCFNTSDGIINITAPTGGGGTYEYSIDGGTSWHASGTFNGLNANTYSVKIRDAVNITCIITLNPALVINQPNILAASILPVNVTICNGNNNGSITINGATGGGGTFEYSINGGVVWQSSNSFTNLVAGTYNVQIRDAAAISCMLTLNATQTLIEPLILSGTVSKTDATCFGVSNGSIAVASAAGGNGTYEYSINGGAIWQASNNFTNIASGTYNVQIRDMANPTCIITLNAALYVDQPLALTATVTPTNVTLCYGDNNGSIVMSVPVGGSGNYEYSVNGGTNWQVSPSFTNLTAGIYNVQIRDANATTCAITLNAALALSQPVLLSINAVTTNVSIYGGSDGMVNITVTGGDSNYSFAWSNSATSEDITGLIAGTYSVIVTDGNFCTATNTYLITQPSSPTCDLAINATVLNNISCNGANNGVAYAEITADSNPITPYIFSWEDAGANIISNNDTIPNLAPGQYIIIVTNNDLSCTTSDTIDITEPDALTLSLSATNITCFGADNGSITAVSGGGGTGAHYYNWSNTETTSTINNLSAGWFILTVTDANNCSIVDSIEIFEPSAISLSITSSDITCNGLNDGAATASATGGNGLYSYIWSNSETTTTINGLGIGWYYVTVNDINNCTQVDSIEIFEPEILAVSLDASMLTCATSNNGSISTTVTGGTTPYNYNWSNGGVTDIINNLAIGNYIVTVTDANNCFVINSIEITEPEILSAALSANNILCNGETIDVTTTVSGGTSPYSYLWLGGETSTSLISVQADTFMVTITDANGCGTADTIIVTEPDAISVSSTISNVLCNGASTGSATVAITGGTLPINVIWSTSETTETISTLAAGTYDVTITDVNGCILIESYSVSEPAALVVNASVNNVSTFGGNDGAIDLTVTGGDTNYIYGWSTAETTEDIIGLSTGTYSVTITDGNLCSITHTSLVTQPSNPGCDLTIATSVLNNITCHGTNDGIIAVSITNDSNPVLPYSFFWTDQADNNISVTDTVNSLAPGQYIVVVMNSDMSCTVYDTVIVTEPDSLVLSFSIIVNNCFGDTTGSVSSTVTGGTSSYSYMWSTLEATDNINNLSAGWYTLTVTDMNNCSVIDSSEITEPALLVLSMSAYNATCFGLNNGSAVAAVSGGVASYLYNWSGSETTDSISNLVANWYSVTATDANLCSVTDSIEIMEPSVITIDTTSSPASSGTAADGSALITVSGGTTPYIYNWSNGSFTEDLINVTTGTYEITVTDINGCTAISSVFVDFVDALSKTVADELGISIYPNPASNILNITGIKEAAITIYDVTGKAIYNSLNNTVMASIDISALTDGTYFLKIISENKVINSKIVVRK